MHNDCVHIKQIQPHHKLQCYFVLLSCWFYFMLQWIDMHGAQLDTCKQSIYIYAHWSEDQIPLYIQHNMIDIICVTSVACYWCLKDQYTSTHMYVTAVTMVIPYCVLAECSIPQQSGLHLLYSAKDAFSLQLPPVPDRPRSSVSSSTPGSNCSVLSTTIAWTGDECSILNVIVCVTIHKSCFGSSNQLFTERLIGFSTAGHNDFPGSDCTIASTWSGVSDRHAQIELVLCDALLVDPRKRRSDVVYICPSSCVYCSDYYRYVFLKQSCLRQPCTLLCAAVVVWPGTSKAA